MTHEYVVPIEDDIDTIARWVIRAGFERYAEMNPWEDIPEVGEYDYERIMERAEKLLPPDVNGDEYATAMGRLELRADEDWM